MSTYRSAIPATAQKEKLCGRVYLFNHLPYSIYWRIYDNGFRGRASVPRFYGNHSDVILIFLSSSGCSVLSHNRRPRSFIAQSFQSGHQPRHLTREWHAALSSQVGISSGTFPIYKADLGALIPSEVARSRLFERLVGRWKRKKWPNKNT